MVPLLRAAISDAVLSLRPGNHGSDVALDIGCGGQPFRALLENAGFNYRGLDVIQNLAGSVHYICAIDEPLPASVQGAISAKLILCTEVLEHVADWQVAFRNIAAMLAPGGSAIVTCPFFFPLHEEPFDFWRPTIHSLKRFAEQAGLQTKVSKLGNELDVLGTLLGATLQYTTSRSIFRRIIQRFVNITMLATIKLMRNSFVRRHFIATQTLYLSNFLVAQKPEASR